MKSVVEVDERIVFVLLKSFQNFERMRTKTSICRCMQWVEKLKSKQSTCNSTSTLKRKRRVKLKFWQLAQLQVQLFGSSRVRA